MSKKIYFDLNWEDHENSVVVSTATGSYFSYSIEKDGDAYTLYLYRQGIGFTEGVYGLSQVAKNRCIEYEEPNNCLRFAIKKVGASEHKRQLEKYCKLCLTFIQNGNSNEYV